MHRRRYFKGREIYGEQVKDIRWLNTGGTDLSDEEWQTAYIRAMGILLDGQVMHEVNQWGKIIRDDRLLILINSHWESVDFTLPRITEQSRWNALFDSFSGHDQPAKASGNTYSVYGNSLALLCEFKPSK